MIKSDKYYLLVRFCEFQGASYHYPASGFALPVGLAMSNVHGRLVRLR